jgi:hypothetical protein
LLLALSAVPVLAAEPEQTPPQSSGQAPDAHQIGTAIGKAEQEEAEHEEWLATPEAEEQREDTWHAFSGIPAGQSEELMRVLFDEQLEALNSDPSRFLSDAQLVRPLGDSGAVVKDEGESSLLETSVPVRTENDEGELAKVDLSLVATPEGFQTENAISEVVLPESADESIQVGEEGFEISQAGASESAANRFGDKNLFYPSALHDTDLFVAPNSFGTELFDLLRSKESPEDLSFEISVPAGAELRSDGRGGAEVVREGETITSIPKPTAVDAQETEVPIQTEVDGDSISLHINHRSGEYAYPILVDPVIEDWVNSGNNWYNGHNWAALTNGAWQWSPESNSDFHHDVCCWEGSHAGLLTIAEPVFFGPEQFGQWEYRTQDSAVWITHAWLIPFNRADGGCGSQQPHDYAGLWNEGQKVWSPIWLDYAKNNGNIAGDGTGNRLVIGEGSGPPGVWLACKRILYAGGAGIWMGDDYPPIVFGVSGLPPSGGWISNETPLHIEVSTGDEGLGVRYVALLPDGGNESKRDLGCTGLYGNRCPNNYVAPFDITGASFKPGIRTNSVSVEDPANKAVTSHFETRVDFNAPKVELSGQLAKATKEEVGFGENQPAQGEGDDELSLHVYRLHIRAQDGAPGAPPLEKQSGMRNIELLLDGKKLTVPWAAQTSAEHSEMDVTYPLQMTGLEAGTHTLEVKATDWVNHERFLKIEFEYIPATGIKDEYVMQHFPLPDGGDESGQPELAVNVMNGNLVYHQRDIDVAGPAVNLEAERFYNSQLPKSQSTEWARAGPWHRLRSSNRNLKKKKRRPRRPTWCARAAR